MKQTDRLIKLALSLTLLFFAVLTVIHATHTVNEGPFFFRRLARLRYAINPDSTLFHRPGRWSEFAWASQHPGGDITAVSTGTAMGATWLITLSDVLDVPLRVTPYIPLTQIGATVGGYLLLRELTTHRLGIVGGAIMLVISSGLAHFHEYRFGRFVALPLILYFAARLLRTTGRNEQRFVILGLFMSVLMLKLTAPGTETTAVFAIVFVCLAGLLMSQTRGEIESSPLYIAPVFVLGIFMLNPKFYAGVAGGLLGGRSAVSYGESGGAISQLLSVTDHIGQLLGSSEDASKYGYSASRSVLEARLSQGYKLIGAALTGLFGLSNLFRTTHKREWSPQFILITAMGLGVIATILLRGVLLGRLGAKGMLLLFTAGSLVGAHYFIGERGAILLGIGLVTMLMISIGAGVADGGLGKPYRNGMSENIATWQVEHVPTGSEQLQDYMTFGNVGYFYAKHSVSNYWNRYPMTSWTTDRFGTLVEDGKPPTDVDYIVIDVGVARYGTKERAYTSYRPLAPHLTTVDNSRLVNRVYTNGAQRQYSVINSTGNQTDSEPA